MGAALDRSVKSCTGGTSSAIEDADEPQIPSETLDAKAAKIAAEGTLKDAQGDVATAGDTKKPPEQEEGEKTPPAESPAVTATETPISAESTTPTSEAEVPGAESAAPTAEKDAEPEKTAEPESAEEKPEVQAEDAQPKTDVKEASREEGTEKNPEPEPAKAEEKPEEPKQVEKRGFWTSLTSAFKSKPKKQEGEEQVKEAPEAEADQSAAPVQEQKAIEEEPAAAAEPEVAVAPASPVAADKPAKEAVVVKKEVEAKEAKVAEPKKTVVRKLVGAEDSVVSVSGVYGEDLVEETDIEVEVDTTAQLN